MHIVNVPISICDMHFSIIKSELILGISELTFLQEVSFIVRVNMKPGLYFSSQEPKAQGELIVWDLSMRPSMHASVRQSFRPHIQT